MKIKRGIKTRLILGYLVVAALTLFAGIFANYGLSKDYDKALNMTNDWQRATIELSALESDTQNLKTYALAGLLAHSKDEAFNTYQDKYNTLKIKWEKDFGVYKQSVQAAQSTFKVDNILGAYQAYVADLDKLWAVMQEQADAQESVETSEATEVEKPSVESLLENSNTSFATLIQSIDNTMQKQQKISTENAAKEGDNYKKIILIVTALCVTAVAMTFLLVVLWAASYITKPILAVTSVMQSVAEGDLTVMAPDIKSKDEFGQMAGSLKEMLSSLRELISNVLDQAAAVAVASQQISAGTQEAAAGSQVQAKESQEITEKITQMAVAAEEMAANAEQATEVSEKTLSSAEQGQGTVNVALEGMKSLERNIKDLGIRSDQIGEIVEVIDEIAEQTNLLALNAAIEAARAGEYGKGFAVVADEIRKLAERSGKATKEIAKIISEIQEETNKAVAASGAGAQGSIEASNAFYEIVNLVRDSVVMVEQISTAANSVAELSTESASGIQSVAAITEEFAATSQEIAASATSLAELSDKLKESVDGFKL